MSGANLQGTILGDADLSGANLRDALNFNDADIRNCRLAKADMSGANLSKVKNLTDAADLSGILLRGADLRGECTQPSANARRMALLPFGIDDNPCSYRSDRGADHVGTDLTGWIQPEARGRADGRQGRTARTAGVCSTNRGRRRCTT